MIRTILFVGKPGSGKETQAKLLVQQTGYQFLSTGEKFRELREHRDALGEHVRTEYDAGHLMPDWYADHLFQEAILHLPIETGIIFEGSGRSVHQAETVDTVCAWLNRKYVVVYLNISDETAVTRIMGRRRDELDVEQKVRTRLAEFARITEPALALYRKRGVLLDIDGNPAISDIHTAVCRALNC